MKQVQTFKFDPDLISDLKSESVACATPFNRYVENLLGNHPYRMKKLQNKAKVKKMVRVHALGETLILKSK